MINEYQFDEYVSLLARVLDYGLNNKYSPDYIENRITGSVYFKALENNDDSVIKSDASDVMRSVYPDCADDNDSLKSNVSIWMSEVYMMIFIKYHKAFSYIFLYASVEWLAGSYDIYHEQDFENIIGVYEERSGEPILSRALKKQNIKMTTLALATSISYDTIVKYCKSNSYLYGASFNNIVKIANYLSLDTNLFVEKLMITTDRQHDKNYLVYYSYLTACLYKNEYKSDNFVFNNDENYYLDNNGDKIYIRITDDLPNTFDDKRVVEALNLLLLKTVNLSVGPNDSLIIYEQNLPPKIKSYLSLDVSKYKNAIIITYMAIYNLKNGKVVRIRDNDARFISQAAEEYSLKFKSS